MWPFNSKKEEKTIKKRYYEAIKLAHSYVSAVMTSLHSINSDIAQSIDILRTLSRDLAKNDPLMARYVATTMNNVVGADGFKFQPIVRDANGTLDERANEAIKIAHEEWSRCGNYEITGKLSRTMGERLMISSYCKNGELLIREHRGNNINRFGYAIEFIDVRRLATEINREASGNNNAVVMGVEIDSFGSPVNYHLYKNMTGLASSREIVIIPASEIIHAFIPDETEQIRGVPPAHASIVRMHHLKKYMESAIIASAVGAAKMGFLTSDTEEQDLFDTDDTEDQKSVATKEVSAGSIEQLPRGVHFESFDPDYPHQMFSDFVKTAKRDIASGLNTSYNLISNDLEGVNFTSLRAGALEDRETWKSLQDFLICTVIQRITANWLESALLSNSVIANGRPLPASKMDKFSKFKILGRRWPWVDVLKEVQAAVLAKDNNLISPKRIMGQQGLDADEVLKEIKEFQDLIDKLGIKTVNIDAQSIDNQQVNVDNQN